MTTLILILISVPIVGLLIPFLALCVAMGVQTNG